VGSKTADAAEPEKKKNVDKLKGGRKKGERVLNSTKRQKKEESSIIIGVFVKGKRCNPHSQALKEIDETEKKKKKEENILLHPLAKGIGLIVFYYRRRGGRFPEKKRED